MESRAYALITGLFVLGIAACIVVWAQWLSKTPIARTSYRVVATVAVSGLNPEAQVRYRGISVGRVSAIGLDPKDPRRILVDIEVDSGIPITKGTYAQLGMEGITGIAYVQLHDDYKNMELAAKGPDGVVELPLRPAFLDVLADGAEGTIQDARQLINSLNELMTPDNRKHIAATLASLEKISANLDVAAARLPATIARVDGWLSDENRQLATGTLKNLNETARDLPQLARETQQLVKDARDLVGQAGKLAGDADGVASSVRDDTLPRINALAEQVERDSQRVGRLALQLDRDPQSLLFGKQPAMRPGPGEAGFK
ncbi:MAG TPA: MlaD family protein [Burkholderiales bacterium]|nr:MlaD family protein [Burkholderiales bacterium]